MLLAVTHANKHRLGPRRLTFHRVGEIDTLAFYILKKGAFRSFPLHTTERGSCSA